MQCFINQAPGLDMKLQKHSKRDRVTQLNLHKKKNIIKMIRQPNVSLEIFKPEKVEHYENTEIILCSLVREHRYFSFCCWNLSGHLLFFCCIPFLLKSKWSLELSFFCQKEHTKAYNSRWKHWRKNNELVSFFFHTETHFHASKSTG